MDFLSLGNHTFASDMNVHNKGETAPDENQNSHEIKMKDSGNNNSPTMHHANKKPSNTTMEHLKLNGTDSKNITKNITKLETASNKTSPGKISSALNLLSDKNKNVSEPMVDRKNTTTGEHKNVNKTQDDFLNAKNSTKEDNSLVKNSTNEQNNTQEDDDSLTASKEDHPRKRILAFGDSLTKGTYRKEGKPGVHPYSKHLLELLKGSKPDTKFEIFEEGVNGECACNSMAKRLPDELEYRKDIDLVIIIAGTNDLLKNDCAHECDLFEAIKRLHETAHRKKAKSVITTILESTFTPAKLTPQEYRDIISEVNQNIRGYANQKSIMGKTMLCDIADEFPRKAPPLIDRIHPSPEGYDKLAEILFNCIKDFDY